MNFKLIEISGSVIRPWKFARHYLKEDQSEIDVMKMNLPVNSFVTYEFQIKSSILFRDLLFTVRPIISAWAVSNRVVDFNELILDEEEVAMLPPSSKALLQDKLNGCISRVNEGEPKDYVKEELPLLTQTSYTIKIDLRILLSFLHTLSIHAPKYFELVKSKILSEIGLSENTYEVLKKYDLFDRVSITKNESKMLGSSANMGEFHFLSGRPAANIMAQFIRQNYSIIKNELWNFIDEAPGYIMSRISDEPIWVIGYLETSAWKGLMTTRTCWFAQMDKSGSTSWDCILGEAVKNLNPEEFISNLPCKGDCNKCRIVEEQIPRINCEDENIPCPILLEYPDLIDKRISKFNSDSKIMRAWLKVKKHLKDNPENKYRVKYSLISEEV